MSVHKSYLSKNNTIIYNSTTNTGLNPVTELFFGRADNVLSTPGYSRFIFDIDLSQLQQKVSDGVVYTGSPMTHKLKMTKARLGAKMKLKSKRTKRVNPISKRVQALNKR
jgi:hypothetical protein